MKTTPLNQQHKQLGARMVPFGGWEMPVQYSGVIDEHLAVRKAAGLFDVSHMGEIEVKGAGALDYIQYLTINDASVLVDGQVQYSAFCYPEGGVVDDVTLYRFAADHFMFCVNASNIDKDFAWMQKVLADSAFENVLLTDRSPEFAQLALQGPKAQAILAGLTDADLDKLIYYHFIEADVDGVSTIISRTGYTGEDGFEIVMPADQATKIWDQLVAAGAVPCGLGARDTLRLEAAMNLYGTDMDETISPLESGLEWTIAWDPAERAFIGRDALENKRNSPNQQRFVGLILEDKGVLRNHQRVVIEGVGEGEITSGGFSPTIGRSIALARVPAGDYETAKVDVRGKLLNVRIVKTPFVRNGQVRIDL